MRKDSRQVNAGNFRPSTVRSTEYSYNYSSFILELDNTNIKIKDYPPFIIPHVTHAAINPNLTLSSLPIPVQHQPEAFSSRCGLLQFRSAARLPMPLMTNA